MEYTGGHEMMEMTSSPMATTRAAQAVGSLFRTGDCETRNCIGLAIFWANFRAQIGIYSQNFGLSWTRAQLGPTL
jgi:hypothetical protein